MKKTAKAEAERGFALSAPGRSPMAVLHALRAAMGSPSQVLMYSAEAARESGAQRRANCSFATSAPGRCPRASLRPPDAAHGQPSQVLTHLAEAHRRLEISRLDTKKAPDFVRGFFHMESGSVLLSRAVSSQVPSALKGLTSVFGMGTGGTLSP